MNCNYELKLNREAPDLKSEAFLFKHKKSGARVFILSNDDENKVFYVGFRTPPSDSTGVAHIMEHSTLCGSRKFPLRDPFVELAKGSLNTFLNAMTYPDKTVYPVASCNDADFRNLQDVYMDAVFYPNVYKHPEILKQEGWSYRIENPEDPITYNGVVYNEMKGVFSSPEDMLMREIMNTLFPDTAYGVESGGDPDCIPNLSYEDFIAFHKKFYHPSNSYIYLYGNIDIEEQLKWLDEEYLSAFDAINPDSEIKTQDAFDEMKLVEKYYPVTDDEPLSANTYLAYNMVCGSCMNVMETVAMDILTTVLVDNQGAPVRQRLIDEGVGKDIAALYDDELLQPYFSIEAKNAEPEDAERFVRIVNEEFEKAASEGVNKKSLMAVLNASLFKYREADYGGYPKGLIFGLDSLSTWLYSDDAPLLNLELGSVFEELEKLIETDYFENLIRKYFLNNNHSSLIIMKPKTGLAEEKERILSEKLSDFKASLSKEEIDKLINDTKELAEYQEKEPTKEELESIPLLSRSDLSRKERSVCNIRKDVAGTDVIWHDYNTNGIAYYSIVFDASKVPGELVSYLGLLKAIVSFVDTEHFTYSELNDEINLVTGGLLFDAGIVNKLNEANAMLLMVNASVRVLEQNIGKSFDVLEEILFTSEYDNPKRIREIISEIKSRMQADMIGAGHSLSARRARSYFSESALVDESINGIEFYKFIENIEKNLDDSVYDVISSIKKVLDIVLKPDGMLVSFTGDSKCLDIFSERFGLFKNRMTEKFGTSDSDLRPVNRRYFDMAQNGFLVERKNEAFKTSGSVNFIARAGKFADKAESWKGAVRVFNTIMRYNYLWFNIRVQGGAYGCMCHSLSDGDVFFVTYRDPNLKRSNDVFEGIPEFLDEFDCDDREMTKYVIGTMSNFDTPLTPHARGNKDFAIYLNELDISSLSKIRNEIIDCKPEDIRALARDYREILKGNYVCAVGCESKINEDRQLFLIVRNLFE